MLVLVITFITGNLKDCLIKELIPLKHLTYGITPKLNYYGTKTRVEFNGSCLKQHKIMDTCGKIAFTLFMKFLAILAITIIRHYKMHYLVQSN